MEFYITLHSDDSLLFYPDNKANHFRVELDAPIHLDNRWMVGLCDIHMESTKEMDFYICSTICQESYVGSGKMALLRRIYSQSKEAIFSNVYYIPIRLEELKTVDIYIKDNQNKCTSFVKGRVVLTLHFK
jgi:hypothetical protein